MSEEQRKKWERTRAKGFNRYIIWFGLVYPILITLFLFIGSHVYDEKINTRGLFIRFILLLIVGFAFGVWSYERNERLYLKSSNKNE